MGDKTQQTSGNLQHEKGATQMNINKRESCYGFKWWSVDETHLSQLPARRAQESWAQIESVDCDECVMIGR